jgi:hypothetical protein
LPGGEIPLANKYVFSDAIEQGTSFYFFSKSFNMPFKVADLIFFSSEEYCFIDAPNVILDDKSAFSSNIKIENCTGKEIEVCFNDNCNISVYGLCEGYSCNSEYDYGYIEKNGKRNYFAGNLIYAGIFSSPEIYECNFGRLMKRLMQVSSLYSDEVNFIARNGCGTAMTSNLLAISQTANSASSKSEQSMVILLEDSERLDNQNTAEGECKLWE